MQFTGKKLSCIVRVVSWGARMIGGSQQVVLLICGYVGGWVDADEGHE